MKKQRCMNCQFFNESETCYRYKGLSRSRFDQCVDYEHDENYRKSNHRDSIEDVVGDISSLVEKEKCFFEPRDNYRLEMLARTLLSLVEDHGVYSWKHD